jgi:hypothetical protein
MANKQDTAVPMNVDERVPEKPVVVDEQSIKSLLEKFQETIPKIDLAAYQGASDGIIFKKLREKSSAFLLQTRTKFEKFACKRRTCQT